MENVRELYLANKGNVIKKDSTRYPGLSVLKYAAKVFYNGRWSPFLKDCRGLVVDQDFNVVSKSFSKIFNYLEHPETNFEKTEIVRICKKINGFMAGVFYYEPLDKVIVNTTGSLDSKYVDYAVEMLGVNFLNWMRGRKETFLFEICHPDDPHIVPEYNANYLIGMRDQDHKLITYDKLKEFYFENFENAGIFYQQCSRIQPPKVLTMPFEDALKLQSRVKHEGFVVESLDGSRKTKLKSDYYSICKMLARSSESKLREKLHNPEHYFKGFESLHRTIRDNFNDFVVLDEQARLAYVRTYLNETSYYYG